jgi:hypothetical protein
LPTLQFTETQIKSLAPNEAAFTAGKKLSAKEQWQSVAKSDRAIWGAIKGSGANPYLTQIDTVSRAYKCTCPSRQFPCKHSIALMLLNISNESNFTTQSEPEWVKAWMDKRVTKEKPAEAEKEKTEEDIERLEKNREKTQENRMALVTAGALELELWLKDLVRMGLLELPAKNKSDFDRLAARMVDAKAPGLGGWVKGLGKLNYDDELIWQREALTIISKVFLLVNAIKNIETLSPLWQQTIRNLAGWSQSTKELLADSDTETVKDHWLVAGQELETTEDEITIQRNWLIGCTTGRQSLILNFGTKFSALESNVVPGTVVEGELAYFPSVWPQRAAFKIQRNISTAVNHLPAAFSSWNSIHQHKVEVLKINPWLNDLVVTLAEARLVKNSRSWIVCDNEKSYWPILPSFDFEKIMRWLAISGNQKLSMTIVLRNSYAIPLGVFQESKYYVL